MTSESDLSQIRILAFRKLKCNKMSNLFYIILITGVSPVYEIVTDEIPSASSMPSTSPQTNEISTETIPVTSKAAPPTDTQSKIVIFKTLPFSISHNGKIKQFNFSENKSVAELGNEIRKLSKCKGDFKISFIPLDLDTLVVLKTIPLLSSNSQSRPIRIVMNCSDALCQQNFESEFLMPFVSTQDQLQGALAIIQELLEKQNQIETQLAKVTQEKDFEKREKQKAQYLVSKFRRQLRVNAKKKIEFRLTAAQRLKILEEHLSPMFGKAMIRCFFNKKWKTIRNLSDKEMCFALTLRGLDRKAYKFLRNCKIIPLPCQTTLQNYIKDFKLSPGILSPMIRLLQATAHKLTDLEKIVGHYKI